jgi:excisionase family DNA binding protein
MELLKITKKFHHQTMIEKYFTTEQVANILQVHPFTILKYIKAGKLCGIKLGRVYRIKESDVKEFLEERMTGSKKASKPKKQPVVDKTVSDSSVSSVESEESPIPEIVPDEEVEVYDIKTKDHITQNNDSEPTERTTKPENLQEGEHYYLI